MLSDSDATTTSNVHWGAVMSNVVRKLSLAWFVSEARKRPRRRTCIISVTRTRLRAIHTAFWSVEANRFIVSLSGVDQVAISDHGLNHFSGRPSVGDPSPCGWTRQMTNCLSLTTGMTRCP